MEYTFEDFGDSSINLEVNGRMTFNDCYKVHAIIEHIRKNRIMEVNIDLKNLQFIDSEAIAMLMILTEHLRLIGGRLLLKNANGQVDRVLNIAKQVDPWVNLVCEFTYPKIA